MDLRDYVSTDISIRRDCRPRPLPAPGLCVNRYFNSKELRRRSPSRSPLQRQRVNRYFNSKGLRPGCHAKRAPTGASVNRYFNSKGLRRQGALCLEAVGFAVSFSSTLIEYALTAPPPMRK